MCHSADQRGHHIFEEIHLSFRVENSHLFRTPVAARLKVEHLKVVLFLRVLRHVELNDLVLIQLNIFDENLFLGNHVVRLKSLFLIRILLFICGGTAANSHNFEATGTRKLLHTH